MRRSNNDFKSRKGDEFADFAKVEILFLTRPDTCGIVLLTTIQHFANTQMEYSFRGDPKPRSVIDRAERKSVGGQ